MFLASTGLRAVEALSIRVKDLDMGSYPAKVTIKGEYTKTKVDRYVFLTRKLFKNLNNGWITNTEHVEFVTKIRRLNGFSIDYGYADS